MVAVVLAFGLVLYLKSIGIMAFGPIPTLVLPLALFVGRAWFAARVAPERIRRQQRIMASMITLICVAVIVSLMISPG